jgi:DNA-binding beta-propeller fold protein YncE
MNSIAFKWVWPVLLVFMCKLGAAQQEPTAQALTIDEFPSNTVWLNLDYRLSMQSLQEKVALIVVSDERCVECSFYLRQLESITQKLPATQLIEVLVADTANPFSRKHLLNYIERNGYAHAIAVVPDLTGFKDVSIKSAPFFILYEKGNRTLMQGGHDGFVAASKRIEILNEQGEIFKTCMQFQYKSFTEPTAYANPVVEAPTYIAYEEGGDHLYLNDAAHNRMIEFDENGTITRLIGTTLPGYFDQNLYTSQFNRPSGMVHSNGKLYIADTHNNRVRAIDMTSEEVTSFLGSGYITWKRAKSIDARFEPIGLPTDVAALGNKLYVASAATNQIFEVDPKDGAATLLCDLPEETVGLLRNCPVNLNAGTNVLYVTMADGKAFKVDRKGKLSELKKGTTHRFVSVCEWKNGIVGVTKEGKVLYLNEDNDWVTVGEQEVEGKRKNDIIVQGATDIMVNSGDLFIVDSDNHMVRMLGSASDKLMKNFWFRVTQELVGFDVANTGGELVLLDSLFLGSQPVNLRVLLDLEGYKIVPQGQNELVPMDITGKIKTDAATIRKEEFTITVDPEYTDPDIYLEFYLTMEKPENKGLFLIKRAYLVIPVIKDEQAEKLQEQIFKPILLRY